MLNNVVRSLCFVAFLSSGCQNVVLPTEGPGSDKGDPDASIAPLASDVANVIGSIVAVRTATDGALAVRAFETSAGDPAFNGTGILVYVQNYDNYSSFAFDTGLDVRTVDSVSLVGQQIVISETSDVPGVDGNINALGVSHAYDIQMDADGNVVGVTPGPVTAN